MLDRSFLIFSLWLLVGGNFMFHVKAVDPKWIVSCSDMELSPSPLTKRETAYAHGKTSSSVEVVCDFETDGGGWTIIQRRTSGPKEEFNKTWTEYSSGFGSLSGNFWLGLENIHALTQNGDQELRIELEDFEGEKRYAEYSRFSVSAASDFYRLKVSGFNKKSTAADILTHFKYPYNGYRFIAKGSGDQKCVDSRGGGGGGWWFGDSCGLSNLNGLYTQKDGSGEGIMWYDWTKGIRHAKSEMKIRKKK